MLRTRIILISGLLVAFVLLLAFQHDFGPQREIYIIQKTGQLAVLCLFLTLMKSPVTKLIVRTTMASVDTKKSGEIRSGLGISTAIFASAHAIFVCWSGFIPDFLSLITEPQWRNGLSALIILLVLAASSFSKIKQAGRITLWKPLHRLSYAAMLFSVLHIFISPYLDILTLISLAVMIIFLVLVRLVPNKQKI